MFLPDGKRFVVYHRGVLDLWEAEPARLLTSFAPKVDRGYNGLAWSPAGKLLAAVGSGEVGLYDPADGSEVRSWKLPKNGFPEHLLWPAGARSARHELVTRPMLTRASRQQEQAGPCRLLCLSHSS